MDERQSGSSGIIIKSPAPVVNPSNTMQPPILTVTPGRILRSPSHESVTTDLSLFSVSSITSDAKCGSRLVTFKSYSEIQLSGRNPSPNPDSRQNQSYRPPDIPEILWMEEEMDIIRNCRILSSVLGLQKSFSTSDISQLSSPDACSGSRGLRSAVSDLAIDFAHRNSLFLEQAGLNHASRSCSTWVAVGDVASNSQLPSPHGGSEQLTLAAPQPTPLPFTTADLVRSVNKEIRQNYIRRRLLTTYRALERLSQSEFNLDRLEAAASAAQVTTGATLAVPGTTAVSTSRMTKDHSLTVRDVERERGKQLSKYERNMMIFNWLHTIDDAVEEGL